MLHDRLRRARALKNMSLQEVADQLGDISKQALSKYEQGRDAPNSTRLIQLADVLGVNPEYFFRSDSVELGEVDFRKHSAFGKKQQEAVKEQVREHLERYLAAESLFETGNKDKGFAQWQERFPVSNVDDIEKAAEDLRQAWNLGTNPIANLTETLEENGIKVVGIEAHEKFDGLCALVNNGVDAVIVSNTTRPGERQRFNLGHELGHLVMNLPAEIHGTRDEESWCHRFAGAFLFPAKQVRDTFGSTRKRILLNEFLLAKEEWGISIQATLRRLFDLGIVQQRFYQDTIRQWSMRGFRKNEPAPLEPENSYRLRQLVYRALAEGLVTSSRAAELLGTSLEEIENIMANGQAGQGKDASESSRF
ncbi:helix-turn-helix domain-containing protein [Marinobacter zhanjiangensis]|uniref:DNA-binding protein n=1 Tax=Marinobacter zhanjiangensis TaxID=578215 RepID=A0ABQ3B115_9GAMM|nr:XRE family transcriptional regulator [Marinobacter zhanjiangensis]GGY73150.1 DNA-binding protein [Marinobacter zhanjiangensis]